MIFTGVVSLLSLVTLRQDLGGAAGANAAALVTAGASHVAIYKWTFLLSQSLMPAVNALLLGSLMYRSRLVPQHGRARQGPGRSVLIGRAAPARWPRRR